MAIARCTLRRRRSSVADVPIIRPCVRGMGLGSPFPLAGRLPSVSSAPVICPGLFGDFSGTMQPSDCLSSYILGVRPKTSRGVPLNGQTQALPAPARDVSVHVRGLRPRRAYVRLAITSSVVLPSESHESVGALKLRVLFSRLNTRPVHSPVNASPRRLLACTHDLEPVWFARP